MEIVNKKYIKQREINIRQDNNNKQKNSFFFFVFLLF